MRVLAFQTSRVVTDACAHFNRFAKLDLAVVPLADLAQCGPAADVAFLLVELEPGAGQRAAQISACDDARAAVAVLAATPLLFVTSPLSAHESLVLGDCELAFTTAAPFNIKSYLAAATALQTVVQSTTAYRGERRALQAERARKNYAKCLAMIPAIAAKYEPDSRHMDMMAFDVLAESRDVAGALRHAAAASERHPTSLRIREKVLALLSQVHAVSQHAQAVGIALRLAPSHPAFLCAKGDAEGNRVGVAAALAAYQSALAACPGDVHAKRGLIATRLLDEKARLTPEDLAFLKTDAGLLGFCRQRAATVAKAKHVRAAANVLAGIVKFFPPESVPYRLWMDLATYQHQTGDAASALQSLAYCRGLAPSDFLEPRKLQDAILKAGVAS